MIIVRLVLHIIITLIAFTSAAMAQCPTGEWRNPTTAPGMSEWSQIAFGNGRFVAVSSGDGQRAAWSTDGMTWNTPTTTLPNNAWRWVTYGNGMFVAVGYSGTRRVATSINGETWNLVNSALTNNGAWQSVTYGNGRFVAVANNGTRVITSQNGTSWTAASNVPAGEWSTVAYGNGMFIALSFGSNPRAMSSPDGLNWTVRTMPSGGWMDAIYGGGQFVAVSWTGNHIATSPDGITWTARSVPDSRSWGAITYTGGHYIVVGGGGSGPNRMMVSSDGIEWVPQPIPHENQTLSTVTWGNDTLVVTGHDLYSGTPQFFIGDCPVGCYMPTAKKGAREWFESADIYRFCDGETWRDFADDGTAGGCSVPGQMEWDDAQAAHTMCDGAQRQILRYAGSSSCSLTSEMLKIGAAATGGTALDYPNAFAVYDNGSKAVVHARWNSRISTWDLSAAPGAPSLIATSPTASGRTDVQGMVVKNGHVFISSPDRNGTGRIWASPLTNIATSYSYPTSGAVGGNNMCNALGMAMNDAGTVAFVPAWDSGGASCPMPAESGSCILNVFDTSDPANMSSIAHVNVSAMLSNNNVYCNGAFWRDSKLFLSFASGPGHGGIAILDVSNPASPSLIGQRWLDGIGNSQIDEMDITPNGNLLILASRAGRVVSMDVSNPANPTILDDSLFLTTGGWTNSVAIVNNYAFISTDPNHIHAVNISDPANLAVDATVSDNMVEDIGHLRLVGEQIYYTSIGNDRFGLLELSCDIENSGPPDLGACTKMAAIDFEPSPPLYKYCDGSSWRPMTGDPCATSPIRAVTNATAANTETARSGTLQNTVDGPRFTLSLWFKMKPHVSNPEIQVLFENTSGRIQLGFYSDHPGDPIYDIWVHGKNSGNTYRAQIQAYDIISENVWYHAIASVDTTSGQGRLYINDLEVDYDVRDIASGGQVMDIQSGAHMVHFFGWPGGFEGEIADFWYDDSYVDLSVEANRRKFISSSGKPVGLGADGSGPTGAQPLIFFSGDAEQWGTNKGRGGTFTQTGTLKNATTLQSDPSTIGNVCHRGIVYVGMHPTIAGSRVYTTTVGEGHFPQWSTENVITGATSFVDGLANQNLIKKTRNIANYPAMQACDNLTAGGYNDWYLPSIAELDLLYSNLVILPFADPDNPVAVYAGSGGWQAPSGYDGPLAGSFDTTGSGWYWSSTEGNAANAYDQSFESGNRDFYGDKTNSGNYNVNKVHCIRREPLGDPCKQQNPIPGAICNDGTIYAGQSPDGNVPMFTTRCDAGQSWNGSACTGTPPYLPWNHGGGGPLADWLLIGVSSPINGTANTATLFTADASSNAGQQNHVAARHCGNLSEGGHNDWYLPSINELEVLAVNRAVIGGFGDNYWSSTEASRTETMANDFWGPPSGNSFPIAKNANYLVRCVRKGM